MLKFIDISILPEYLDLFNNFPKQLYPEAEWAFKTRPISEEHLFGKYLLLDEYKVVARFALYNNPELNFNGKNTWTFGAYECFDDPIYAEKIFIRINNLIEQEGGKYMIGPMEGSTWNDYRWECSDQKRYFFTESRNKAYYKKQIELNGFNIIANYRSNIDKSLHVDQIQTEKIINYFQSKGANIRSIDLENIEKELVKLGAFSIETFKDNFLYTRISPDSFCDKYKTLKSHFDPNFILIAENQDKEIEAFVFALPDHRDDTHKTLIIKSIATKKHSPFKGMASLLCRKITHQAKALGYENVIHAYMHENNQSINSSFNYADEVYRRYVLFGKTIN